MDAPRTSPRTNGQDLVRVVENLLGTPNFADFVRATLKKGVLPDGRFEAQEFGRNQHSSASAGALVYALSSIPLVTDETIAGPMAALDVLVSDSGEVRGHDDLDYSVQTSWALAQVALGLLGRPQLLPAGPKAGSLIGRICRAQQASGGWALRRDETDRPAFSFYPTMALARARQVGITEEGLLPSLVRARHYLESCMDDQETAIEERFLGVRALRSLYRLDDPGNDRLDWLRGWESQLREAAWSNNTGLRLQDRTVIAHDQPMWYVTFWRPLFYMVLRKSIPPTDPLQASLGHELISCFRPNLQGWRGPAASGIAGGVSWATALATLATYQLAVDLHRSSVTPQEWLGRCRGLVSRRFEFDFAISYAGADRAIAREISATIRSLGCTVFYDHDYQHVLLGEDLTIYLQRTYFSRSRYAIVVISEAFIRSKWGANWEWKAILARMQSQQESYLLPYFVEEVDLPGLNTNIAYVSMENFSPGAFAELVVRKLLASAAEATGAVPD